MDKIMRLRNNEGDYMDFQCYLNEKGCAEITIDENDQTNHTFSFELNETDLKDIISWAQEQVELIKGKTPS